MEGNVSSNHMYNQAVYSSPFWSEVGTCKHSCQMDAHYIWKREEVHRLLSLQPQWFSLHWRLASGLGELMSCTMALNGTSSSRDSLGLFSHYSKAKELLPSCFSQTRHPGPGDGFCLQEASSFERSQADQTNQAHVQRISSECFKSGSTPCRVSYLIGLGKLGTVIIHKRRGKKMARRDLRLNCRIF